MRKKGLGQGHRDVRATEYLPDPVYLNEEQREVNQDSSFVKEVKSCIQGELALILWGK